jgi:hypothetical protein
MRKVAAFIGLLVLFGCSDENTPDNKKITQISLKCGLYDVVVEPLQGDTDTIQTAINGEKIRMNRATDASGNKFEGRGAVAKVSILNKGDKWSLSIDNGGYIYCSKLQGRK